MKKRLGFAALILLMMAIGWWRQQNENDKIDTSGKEYLKVEGKAQGTTYTIIYDDSLKRNLSAEFDSILLVIDNSMSTYNPASLITEFNYYKEATVDTLFGNVLNISREVYDRTNGLFNPAIFPLIEAWGFGLENKEEITEELLDSLKNRIELNEIVQLDTVNSVDGSKAIYLKSDIGTQLNFNAIAQGYSVDVIEDYLRGEGVVNYMIEIGGEIKVEGESVNGSDWILGIEKPDSTLQHNEKLQERVFLSGKAMATSGNYRKFYKEGDQIFSHTINPVTGKPVNHNTLSVTVFANDCATADAYATAFMVMGAEKAVNFVKENTDLSLDFYGIKAGESGYEIFQSEGMEKLIIKN